MAISENSLQDQKPVAICVKCGKIFKITTNSSSLHTKELLCGDCNK